MSMSLLEDRAYQYRVNEKGEGGLTCESDRSPMVDKPTIIIGLGGTGIDAMLHVKSLIQRRIKAPEGRKMPGRIAFVGIDSDELAFSQKCVGDVRVEHSEQVLISEPGIADLIRHPERIPNDYRREWLSKGIFADNVMFGAGGVRQVGRFMLINKAQQVIDRILHAALSTWSAGKENGNAFAFNECFNVYILTGICGGTGSGIFLDTAYLVRHVIRERLGKWADVRGFVFMPEVNLIRVYDARTRQNFVANGYAALRELDFWMNDHRGRDFVQQYTPDVVVNEGHRPFDHCFLISPEERAHEDYHDCMHKAGEMLMNILTEAVPGAMNFNALLPNVPMMMQQFGQHPENCIFSSIEIAQQRIPQDVMTNYLGNYLLNQVRKSSENRPDQQQMLEFFKGELRLDFGRGQWQEFNRNLPASPFADVVRDAEDFRRVIADYNRADVLNGDILETELSVWVSRCREMYKVRRHEWLDECMRGLKEKAESMFADPGAGPYYVQKMLHSAEVDAPDMRRFLEQERSKAAVFLNMAMDREGQLRRELEEAKQAALSNRLILMINRRRYDDYAEAAFRYYDHIRFTEYAKIAYDLYGCLIREVDDYCRNVVMPFVEMIQYLSDVLKRNVEIIANVRCDVNEPIRNIGSFGKIKEKIDAELENLKNSGGEEALVSQFLQMMLRNRDAWIGSEGGLGTGFSQFIVHNFPVLMNQSIEQTYMEMYNLTTLPQLDECIGNEVLPEMQRCVMRTNRWNPVYPFPRLALILVPFRAVNLLNAVNHRINGAVPGYHRDLLTWMQLTCGLPLCAYEFMEDYRAMHDCCKQWDNHCGRYLRMGANENWDETLPHIVPERRD